MNKKSNLNVAIRVRPLIEKETKKNEFEIITVQDQVIFAEDPVDKKYENKIKLDVYHRSREKQYKFDNVYTTHSINQIFEETVEQLITQNFKGYNGCVFAYGATGTGKTHTMLGDSEHQGLIKLSL